MVADGGLLVRLFDVDGGALVSEAVVSEWGEVTKGFNCGNGAPWVAFSKDGAVVYVRAASTDLPAKPSTIHVVDVRSGRSERVDVACRSSWLTAVAVDDDDRVLALFDSPGERAGLCWYERAGAGLGLRELGNVEWCGGGCVVPRSQGGAWTIGDTSWAWRVDVDSGEIGDAVDTRTWEQALRAREARRKRLAARAKAKWDREHLEYVKATKPVDSRLSFRFPDGMSVEPAPQPSRGTRIFHHAEPWMIPQAIAFGDDDVLVRDGVRVAVWRARNGARSIEVVPLVEDTRSATTAKARITTMSHAGDILALAFRPSSSSPTSQCVLLRVDRAALA